MFPRQQLVKTMRQIAGLSGESRWPLLPLSSFLSLLLLPPLFFGCDSTSRPAGGGLSSLSSSWTEPLWSTSDSGAAVVALCLKTSCVIPMEGLFVLSFFLFFLTSLQTHYISHQPLGLNTPPHISGGLNMHLHDKCFSHFNQLYLWMWRHVRVYQQRYMRDVKFFCFFLFTIEWFVHINISYVMLNVFPWWLFLGFVWLTLHERQQGLNWTDALCP